MYGEDWEGRNESGRNHGRGRSSHTPGLKETHFDTCGFSAEGILISAYAISHRMDPTE